MALFLPRAMPGGSGDERPKTMSGPLLCETIAAPTMAALRAQRDAVTQPELVELRLDLVDRPDVAGALAGRTRPVLVT